MADEKVISERDAVMRERAAFTAGQVYRANSAAICSYPSHCQSCEDETARRYPLPKVTRPRVLRDTDGSDYEFKVVGHAIHAHRPLEEDWHFANNFGVSRKRITLWADLLANPTEEVDAE